MKHTTQDGSEQFEAVIGLEVHAELLTESKIFCSCSTAFGAPPNTQCCPVCLGYPGAMPRLNRHVVELAVTAGLALGCEIATYSRTDRKHYFYPDLPKAYQISQDGQPLCRNGKLTFSLDGEARTVRIDRIHIEEDAGKLIHEGGETLIDCNRCGVPLIEIVFAPELHSARDASACLRALRAILLASEVSDCRMQEGSLRCDVNISLRARGSDTLGVRTEIKNLNSFAFTEKAIAYEIERQSELLLRGEALRSETRRYDPTTGKTYLMRVKERAVDYRFLPEPDLPPIRLTQAEIEARRKLLPELPDRRAARLTAQFCVTPYDASVLVSDRALADYFEEAAGKTAYPKLLANLLISELLRFSDGEMFDIPVSATRFSELVELVGNGTINSSTAKKLLGKLLIADFDLSEAVEREHLAQIRDRDTLTSIIRSVLAAQPRAVADYRGGKHAALRALQGRVMAETGGRADPILAEELLLQLLSQSP